MMKFAEVTPINPYSVERVQEHFDVCPASYSQLLCPNAPYAIPPVKPRPLPPDFKYNQVNMIINLTRLIYQLNLFGTYWFMSKKFEPILQ